MQDGLLFLLVVCGSHNRLLVSSCPSLDLACHPFGFVSRNAASPSAGVLHAGCHTDQQCTVLAQQGHCNAAPASVLRPAPGCEARCVYLFYPWSQACSAWALAVGHHAAMHIEFGLSSCLTFFALCGARCMDDE